MFQRAECMLASRDMRVVVFVPIVLSSLRDLLLTRRAIQMKFDNCATSRGGRLLLEQSAFGRKHATRERFSKLIALVGRWVSHTNKFNCA
jgi:hypothetical protein